ncbi:MAG: hypothetical protein IJB36_04250 [Clostridia bacterium]|nr:hypothetical protein [Clostridia bacterium]
MKKLFAVALATVMLLALCACGNKKDDKKETNNTTQPVGDTAPSNDTTPTKIVYATNQNGEVVGSQAVTVPDKGDPEKTTTTTTPPTFTYEDDNQFNDATLAW